jgi:hypothetical protein
MLKIYSLDFRKKIIRNGKTTVSYDDWCGDTPFPEKFKRLFDLTFDKNILVAKALQTNLT